MTITIDVESNLTPIDIEAVKDKVTAYTKKLVRSYEKKQELKLEDFFGMFGSDPETVNMPHKELRELIMQERYGI